MKSSKESSAPLVVEFIGLPGVGKTTVAREVLSELNSIGYKCLSRDIWRELRSKYKKSHRLKEFYDSFVFCASHTHIAFNALSYAVRVIPLNITSLRLGLFFLRKLSFIRSAIKTRYDIILLDQGLMQYIWSIPLRGSPPPNKHLIRMLKTLSDDMPQVVVVFDVDIDTAVKRIARRPTAGSDYDRMAPDVAERSLAKHKNYIDEIVDCAVQLNGTCRLNVNGNDDVRKKVSAISQFIDEISRSRLGQTWEI